MALSSLNYERVLRDVHDEARNTLRVDANISAGGQQATITDVAGKKSLDVNVTDITITSANDSIETRSQAMKIIIDEVSTSITYVGEAATGSSTSGALWRVKRITTSGVITTIEWADGNGNFDNIWNNRASLSYS